MCLCRSSEMSSGDTNMPPPPPSGEFKKPPAQITIGKVGGKKKYRAPEPPKPASSPKTSEDSKCSNDEDLPKQSHEVATASAEESTPTDLQKETEAQTQKQLYPPQKCPYDEPSWGCQPEVEYR